MVNVFIASLLSSKGTNKENYSRNAVYSKALTLNVRLGIFHSIEAIHRIEAVHSVEAVHTIEAVQCSSH